MPQSDLTMKALLEAGVHFGHRTRRWNPKMRSYIFTERNGIHIIDLGQTLGKANEAYERIRDITQGGGVVLFVGTKRQAQDTVTNDAERAGMPYVSQRWLGGTLTNFLTIRRRVSFLRDLEARVARGELDLMTKKEALDIERQIDRLNRRLGGIKGMETLPDALFVIDVRREHIAVKEANILGIPVIAMVDTNCDPDPIDLVIPSNDDAIRAIRLLCGAMADAALEGSQMRAAAYVEELETEMAQVDVSRRVFSPDDEVDYASDDDYDDDYDEDEDVVDAEDLDLEDEADDAADDEADDEADDAVAEDAADEDTDEDAEVEPGVESEPVAESEADDEPESVEEAELESESADEEPVAETEEA